MKKLIIICLLCILFYGLGYNHCKRKYDFHTQAEMIRESNKDSHIADTEFESVCNRIIETFKSDKQFIENFKKDKEEFLKYRETQINTILPQGNCFTNYQIYANSYREELTEKKLIDYKRTVKTYCLYSAEQPENICSDETIEDLFKIQPNKNCKYIH